MNVDSPEVNRKLIEMLGSNKFLNFKQHTEQFENVQTQEKVHLLTLDSWFMRIPDKLRYKCLQELAHVKFSPALNLKTSEQVH